MNIEVLSVIADQPSRNGRIYSSEVLKKMVSDINESKGQIMIMDHNPPDNKINLLHVVGVIDTAEIDDGKINLECIPLPGKGLAKFMDTDLFEINPVSTGTVETKDGVQVVTDCKLEYFTMDPRPSIAESFKSGKPIPELAAIPESKRLPTEREIMGERLLDL